MDGFMKKKSKSIGDPGFDYLENIIALLPGHIFWKDLECRFLGCNDRQAQIAGLTSREDIVGKSAYDVITKNQSEKARRKQAAAIDAVDREIMRTGTPKTVEEPLILNDGSERIFLSQKIPLRDKDNKVVGLLGIGLDITDLKEAKQREQLAIEEAEEEKIKAEEATELRRSISVFAGSIAHDLRTPLTSTLITADLFSYALSSLEKQCRESLKDKPEEFDKIQVHLERCRDFPIKLKKNMREMNGFIDITLKSMQRLVSGLLSHEDFSVCEIEPCIYDSLDKYPFLDNQRTLIKIEEINNFSFLGYPALFYRLLFNLINNAIEQINKNKGGEIFISTEKGEEINILRIKDTAGGASPDIVTHLFDGYRTTKKNGTGVGLAFCQLTMKSFGGDITCEAVEGDYMAFTLSFPAINDKVS